MMRAISLWEPWASAMALGFKANETRGQRTHIRGDVVICAAQRAMTKSDKEILAATMKLPDGYVMPYGCAVAVVEIYDCVRAEDIRKTLSPQERALGDYADGRFVWLTRNVRRLSEPVPVKGKQGFFFLPPDVEQLVRIRCR